MTSFNAMMLAFEEMRFQLDQREHWIITVFADGDPRVQGNQWLIENGDVPVVFMSDDLYALYCVSTGIDNQNARRAS